MNVRAYDPLQPHVWNRITTMRRVREIINNLSYKGEQK